VLAACGLAREAAGLWPEGLEKHVGEAAAGLSGGEQSRVALARAVYSDADVVLLDDVLAALDGATRSLVADELLRGLLRDKLVVLATHDAWVAQHADHVLWLDAADAAEAEAEVQDGGDGRGATSASAPAFNSNPTRPTARDPPPGVSVFGRTWSGPGPAMRRDPLLQALMARVPEEEAAEETPDGSSKAVQSSDEAEEAKGGDERPVMEELGDTPFADADDADDADAVPEEDPASAAPAAGTAAESLATGRVTSSVYAVYASLCGGKLWVAAVLLLCGLCQAALLLTSQAVVWWVEYDSSADHAPSHGVLNFYGAFYLGQVVLLAAFGWVRNQTLLRGCLAGGRLVHARMLQGVTRAPLAWFGAHPMGQVMNRFSADLGMCAS
jgi:energy-coupling factor transporter ATP-binding protein EcfA2